MRPVESIPEPDWKVFKVVRETALDRHYAQAVEACRAMIEDDTTSHRERFHDMLAFLRDSDRRMRDFEDFRRPTALVVLGMLRAAGLVTDEELLRFSAETQHRIRLITSP
jgi:hypothetical protein